MGTVRISDRFFTRYLALIAILAVTIGLGIMVTPSKSLAQNGTSANQDAGQAATPSAVPPQRKKVELPDGDGKAIAEKSCHECHELTNLTHASKNLEDWRDTVKIMVDNGADVPMDKIDILVTYLAKNFGPKTDASASSAQASPSPSPASPDVLPSASSHAMAAELPDGDGKEIAKASCQACHKLTNLTSAHKNTDDWRETVQLMMDRGAEVAPDKVETLVHYLAKNFGPKDTAPGSGATSTSSAQPH
jgi:cytochrome c5